MFHAYILVLGALTTASALVQTSAAQWPKKSEWQSLFNGRNLEGWEGNPAWFRVEAGCIVAGSLERPVPRNEFLCTHKTYGDFELRLRFKLLGTGANAGIQIRSKRVENSNEVSGYQADLGEGWWGALYDEARRNRPLRLADTVLIRRILRQNDWNDYRIVCEGKRIRLYINGSLTADYTETETGIAQRGVIGLQIHGGGPSEAWYRKVEIRER